MSLLLAVLIAAAQQVELPTPPRGYGTSAAEVVVDAAGVLDQGTIDRLNRIAFEVHARTGGEMAIVTLRDLRGRDVADVALRIGREWGVGSDAGVGDRRRNAGVVVLLVPKETASDGQGRIRIETGRGVEGFITDGMAGDIQRGAIPYFQRQDYGGGLVVIAAAIADRFAREFGVALDTAAVPPVRVREPVQSPVQVPMPSFGTLLLLALIAFFILSGLSRSGRRGGGSGCLNLLWAISVAQSHGRHRGGWGGGGFGGGSFGGGGGFGGFGGGGGFSGGGSSGSW